MISMEQIREEVAKFLKKDLKQIQDDTPLIEMVRESFELIEMVIELQEIFEVRLHQEDLVGVQTLGDFAAVLQKVQHRSSPQT